LGVGPHLCAAVVTVVVGVVAELTAAIVTGVALSLLLHVHRGRPGQDRRLDPTAQRELAGGHSTSRAALGGGLTTLVHSLHGHGNLVYLADIEPSQRAALSRSGLLALLGPDAVVWRDPVIGAAAAEATRRAGAWLAGHRPEPSRGSPPRSICETARWFGDDPARAGGSGRDPWPARVGRVVGPDGSCRIVWMIKQGRQLDKSKLIEQDS
jgi:hypothetical protein